MILFGQYIQIFSQSGQTGRYLNWFSSAVRVAQRLGLHRLGSNSQVMPPDDPALPPGSNSLKRETAVRLFHHLVNIDTYLSDSPSLRCYVSPHLNRTRKLDQSRQQPRGVGEETELTISETCHSFFILRNVSPLSRLLYRSELADLAPFFQTTLQDRSTSISATFLGRRINLSFLSLIQCIQYVISILLYQTLEYSTSTDAAFSFFTGCVVSNRSKSNRRASSLYARQTRLVGSFILLPSYC